MAKKEELGKELKDLKAKIKDGKVVIGIKDVLKNLRMKSLDNVYLASNCPVKIKEEIVHYTGLVKVPIVNLKLDNGELGLFCKKSFLITVLGTKAEE